MKDDEDSDHDIFMQKLLVIASRGAKIIRKWEYIKSGVVPGIHFPRFCKKYEPLTIDDCNRMAAVAPTLYEKEKLLEKNGEFCQKIAACFPDPAEMKEFLSILDLRLSTSEISSDIYKDAITEADMVTLCEEAYTADDFRKALRALEISPNRTETRKQDQDGFDVEFIDRDIIEPVYCTLRNFIDRYWKVDGGGFSFIVPFTSVTMSSGYGKSRTLIEVAKKKTDLEMVYGCVRATNDYAFPRCNINLLSLLRKATSLNDMVLFIKAVIVTYWRDYRHELSYDRTLDSWANFWGSTSNLISTCLCEGKSRDSLDKAYSKIHRDIMLVKRDKLWTKTLVVVLDEPDAIGTPYWSATDCIKTLRMALNYMKNAPIFFVFLDTISNIVEENPPVFIRRTHKIDCGSTERKFLPSIYTLTTMDVRTLADDSLQKEDSPDFFKALFSLGRPLWSIYAEEYPRALEIVVNYAGAKLVFCLLEDTEDFDLCENRQALVAVMSVKFGLSMIKSSTLSRNILAFHMATAVYINDTRDMMITKYPSEPILAEGASAIFYNSVNSGQLCEILKKFHQEVISGEIDINDIGELLARVLLSLAIDNADPGRNFKSQSVSIKTFWDELVGSSFKTRFAEETGLSVEFMDIPKEFEGAKVAFTHWIFRFNPPTLAAIKDCYYRRCAIVMPAESSGIDIIIPVKMDDDSLGMIVVKVENSERLPGSSARSDIMPSNTFACRTKIEETGRFDLIVPDHYLAVTNLPYIALFMTLRCDFMEPWPENLRNDVKDLRENPAYRNHYILLGFTPKIIQDSEVHDAMMDLLLSSSADVVLKTGNNIINYMCPLEIE